MAMPTHVYRVKNVETGTTVKRVGADNYRQAKYLADNWAATLTRETGVQHIAQKVRNPYGHGK